MADQTRSENACLGLLKRGKIGKEGSGESKTLVRASSYIAISTGDQRERDVRAATHLEAFVLEQANEKEGHGTDHTDCGENDTELRLYEHGCRERRS